MSDQQQRQSVPSINDSLPSGNPSGKTVLIVISCFALAFFMLLLYSEYFQ